MEDWDVADGFRVYEPTQSLHPAHTFRISTRDLARFGQLYLNEGRWLGDSSSQPPGWPKVRGRTQTTATALAMGTCGGRTEPVRCSRPDIRRWGRTRFTEGLAPAARGCG
jgi:CubicO group peptidase (beta-lactamase class C family)